MKKLLFSLAMIFSLSLSSMASEPVVTTDTTVQTTPTVAPHAEEPKKSTYREENYQPMSLMR